MKRLKYKIFIVLLVFTFSCEDDLNVDPPSVITTASMWNSEGDAVAAMYGALSQFRSALGQNYIRWGEYRSGYYGDALGSQASYQDMFLNSLDDQDVGTNWAPLYTTINDCNLILKYVPEIEFSDDGQKRFVLANALFIRAFSYFYLARVWGDSPVVLAGYESGDQDDLFPTRAPVADVLDQVAQDIEASLAFFQDSSSGSRKDGSAAAAYMLKTEFYLWMARTQGGGDAALQQANEAVDQVLSNSNYALLDEYESVFRNEGNDEIIFALNYEREEYEGGFASDWLVAIQYVNDKSLVENPIKVGSHQQWVTLTDEFEDFLFENGSDTRSIVSLDSYDEPGNTRFKWINKYLGSWTDNTRFFISDTPVYRFAEAHMFKAEIANLLGDQAEALTQLNIVAGRAYGTDDFYSGSYSMDQLDNIILEERLKEFASEGKAWWDLIRFDQVFDRVATLDGKEGQQNILYWPVNAASINSNPNINQTPGY